MHLILGLLLSSSETYRSKAEVTKQLVIVLCQETDLLLSELRLPQEVKVLLIQARDSLVVLSDDHTVTDFNTLICQCFSLRLWNIHDSWSEILRCTLKIAVEILLDVGYWKEVPDRVEDAYETLEVSMVPKYDGVHEEVLFSYNLDYGQWDW